LKINLEAVDEVARQIRLRDMGGIIVIDFIDMRDPKRKTQLHQALKQAMSTDRARHNILPMTKFGLVQITRERVRPAMEIVTSEVCPTCNGSGRIDSSMQLIDRLENEVTYLWENLNLEKLTLKANPLLTGFIKSGFPSQRMRWFRQYGHWLRLKPDTSMGLSSFHFENQQGQAISNQ
jgi:ribonuclease G